MSVVPKPTIVARITELMATPQFVPPPKQASPQMSAANNRSMARPGANSPWLPCSAANSDLPTGKKMNKPSSAAMTTTIIATVISPTKKPLRANERAKTKTSASSAA